mmetsp:Transcript_62800/g.141858  ORF Transcript_62800/g.141858 Transcript_62800/m.141858 type:complete len:284 (+) Transcript_62800:173-1024(+)
MRWECRSMAAFQAPSPSANGPGSHVALHLLRCRVLCCPGWSHVCERGHGDDPRGVHVALDVGDVAVHPLDDPSKPLALVLHLHPVACGHLWPRRYGTGFRVTLRLSEAGKVSLGVEGIGGGGPGKLHCGPLGHDDSLRGLAVHQEDCGLRLSHRGRDHLCAHDLPEAREALHLGLVDSPTPLRGGKHARNLSLQLQRHRQPQPRCGARGQLPGGHAAKLHAPAADRHLTLAAAAFKDHLLREVYRVCQPLQERLQVNMLWLYGAAARLDPARHQAWIGHAQRL